MWARLFPFVVWILDFFHVVRRLAECAHEVALPGAAFEKYFHKWKTLLHDGRIDGLRRSLAAHARRFANRPERPSDLPERTPGRILWTHVFYIEKYRDHMDYPEYRPPRLAHRQRPRGASGRTGGDEDEGGEQALDEGRGRGDGEPDRGEDESGRSLGEALAGSAAPGPGPCNQTDTRPGSAVRFFSS